MMRKYAVLGFEPMTYGSESECATHYTTAPQKKQAEVNEDVKADY